MKYQITHLFREARYWSYFVMELIIGGFLLFKCTYILSLFILLFVFWGFMCPGNFLAFSNWLKRAIYNRERARYTDEEWEKVKDYYAEYLPDKDTL